MTTGLRPSVKPTLYRVGVDGQPPADAASETRDNGPNCLGPLSIFFAPIDHTHQLSSFPILASAIKPHYMNNAAPPNSRGRAP